MIRIYQIKNLEETVMEIVILKGKIVIERIKNNLDEFEMKELELEAEAEIDALKIFEKPIRKRIQLEIEELEIRKIAKILIKL